MKGSVLETIGTPLIRVGSPAGVEIAAKHEAANPGGSAKDRPAVYMIETAERDGHLEPGGRIVEPTSGNTGIGLALAAAIKGYDLTLVMPESKSAERRRLMAAYGAELELVEGTSIEAARERADELAAAPDAIQLGQFENPNNPRAHYETTGPEILEQVGDRSIDAFVATVGTGGTLSGTAKRLQERFPDLEVVAVEPDRNAVLSTGAAGEDEFQGMGPGFVAENLDVDRIDTVETVRLEDAEAECRRLAREEGLLVGQSSGAAMIAARRVGERIAAPDGHRPDAPDRSTRVSEAGFETVGYSTAANADDCPLVVTVFPDSGERYLSAGLFD